MQFASGVQAMGRPCTAPFLMLGAIRCVASVCTANFTCVFKSGFVTGKDKNFLQYTIQIPALSWHRVAAMH